MRHQEHYTFQLLEYIEDHYQEIQYSEKKVNQLFLKANYSLLKKYQQHPLFFYFSLDFDEKGIKLYPSTIDFILKNSDLNSVDFFERNPLMNYLSSYSENQKLSPQQLDYLTEHSHLSHVDHEGLSAIVYAVQNELPIEYCKKLIDLNVTIFHPKDKIIKAILTQPKYFELFSYLLTNKNLKIHSELYDWMKKNQLSQSLSVLDILQYKTKIDGQLKNTSKNNTSLKKL
jgi:hypothetical protein